MTAAKKEEYELLVEQAKALVAGESDWIANTANLSALLFNSLNNVNFAGVYRFENGELILGPFQGMPACVHIQMGKGVCGTALKQKKHKLFLMFMNFRDILHVIVLLILKLLCLFLKMINFGAFLILIQLN